jgi:hypothetical protein
MREQCMAISETMLEGYGRERALNGDKVLEFVEMLAKTRTRQRGSGLPVVIRFSLVLDLDRDMGQSVKSTEQ